MKDSPSGFFLKPSDIALAALLGLCAAIVSSPAQAVQEEREHGPCAVSAVTGIPNLRPLLTEELAEIEKDLGSEEPETLRQKECMAEYLYKIGARAEARDMLSALAESRERLQGSDHPDTLKTRNSLGFIQFHLGRRSEAVEIYAPVLETMERVLGAEHADTLNARRNLAHALDVLGEYAEELEQLEKLVHLMERTRGAEDPQTLVDRNNLAVALWRLGELGQAREILRQVLEIQSRTNGPDHENTLASSNNLAVILQELGQLEEARELHARVLKVLERAKGPNHPDTLLALQNLAAAEADLGELKVAREMLERVAGTLERTRGQENVSTLSAKLSLSNLLAVSGEIATATETTSGALGLLELTLGPEHLMTLAARTELAVQLEMSGESAAARDLLLPALETATRSFGIYHPLPTMIAAGLGVAFAGLGDLGQSVFFLKLSVNSSQKAREKLSTLDRDLRRGYLRTVRYRYHLLFDILMKTGRTAEAMAVLELLKDDELRGLDPEPSVPRSRRDVSEDSLPANSESSSGPGNIFVGTIEEAAHMEYSRVAEADAALGSEYSSLLEKRDNEGLTEEEQSRFASVADGIAESRAAFINVCESLPHLLKNGEGIVASRAMGELLTRQETLGEMGEGTVIVHAVSTENTLYVVLLTSRGIVTRKSAVGREELAALVSRFRALLLDPSKDPRQEARLLYDAVFKPLEEDLEKSNAVTVMLSLDGTLRYVPLAALWDGEKWLAEKYPTAIYTESAADSLLEGLARGGETVRAFGVTVEMPSFPALPGVADEIAGIVRTDGADPEVPGRGVLDGAAFLDAEFTREALSRNLAGARVVHVASHFRLDPTSHENSLLLLGDGTLSLRQIRLDPALVFRDIDLLTLSACDTASGASRGNGEGVEMESLGVVVQRRGASAVLASLWPVADRSTADLMREFYRLYYLSDMDKAMALREAQLAVMRDDRSAPAEERGTVISATGVSSAQGANAPSWEGYGYSHPYFWAPFLIMGNWR